MRSDFSLYTVSYAGSHSNRVAKKMGTYFEMGMNGHRFVCFQIGIIK